MKNIIDIKPLTEVESRYRVLLDTISHGVQVNDCEGTITYSNRAHHMILGYEYGELLGKKIWDMVYSPDERENLKKFLGFLVNEQPTPVPYFAKNKRKDGSLVDLQISWDYDRDNAGVLIGFISVITDMSALKQAENTLKERKKILRNIFDVIQEKENILTNIFDAIPDEIRVLDRDFNVIQVNKNIRQLHSHMMPIEGKKCYEVYHGRSKPCKVCPTAKALKSKKPEREEIPFVKAGGVVGTLELFAYPIIDESGEISGFVVHLRDISNPKIEK